MKNPIPFQINWRNKWLKAVGISLLIVSSFYMLCLNFVGPAQIGIARNIITGETKLQNQNGWNISPPWVYVPRIDIRPIRVEVNSAGHGFSAKLVQFNPEYWEGFTNTEGIYYYWWANRISFNLGYNEEHRGIRDILRGYAYSPKKYQFISILDEYAE